MLSAAFYVCAAARLLSTATADPEAMIAAAGNVCPDGWSKITSVAACRAAMDLVGYNGEEYKGDEDESSWPSGCYFCDDVGGCQDGFWFNEDTKGAAKGKAQPVCGKGLEPLSDTTSILFMGDSDVDYWQTQGYDRSHNVAVGGYTCKDVFRETDAMLDAFGPGLEWVVLVCGENDIAYGTKPSKAFKRFKSIVDEVVATGARLLYMGTKPEPSTKSMWDEYREYDELIREYATSLADAGADPPLVMVDVYPAFETLGNPNSFYRRDKLHLSSEGYALWDQWATLALGDSSGCVRWLGGACDDEPSPEPSPEPSTCVDDDPDWRARKCGKKKCDCAWVGSSKRRKKKRCRKKKDSNGVKARDACCATCSPATHVRDMIEMFQV